MAKGKRISREAIQEAFAIDKDPASIAAKLQCHPASVLAILRSIGLIAPPPAKLTHEAVLEILAKPGACESIPELHLQLSATDPSVTSGAVERAVHRLHKEKGVLFISDWKPNQRKPNPRYSFGNEPDRPYEPQIARIPDKQERIARFTALLTTPIPPSRAFLRPGPVALPAPVKQALRRGVPASPFTILYPTL